MSECEQLASQMYELGSFVLGNEGSIEADNMQSDCLCVSCHHKNDYNGVDEADMSYTHSSNVQFFTQPQEESLLVL